MLWPCRAAMATSPVAIAGIPAEPALLSFLAGVPEGSGVEPMGGYCNNPPEVTCPPYSVVECAPKYGAVVTLTSHVEDPDGDGLCVAWSVDGALEEVVLVDPEGPPTSEDVSFTHTYSPGVHTVGVQVDDGEAAPVCCETKVVVKKDKKAPEVTCSLDTTSLWPPNHDLVNVGLDVAPSDACDPSPSVGVAVFGDEDDETPTGDGHHSPDAKDIAAGTLRLRSERKGDADGRVYLLVTTAEDAAGNVGFDCCTVVVPHDQSPASISAVSAQAAAAEAYCLANGGAPPPTFFVVGDGPVLGPKQ